MCQTIIKCKNDNYVHGNLPDESKSVSVSMKEFCGKIETLFELEVLDDLLQTKTK